MPAVLLNKTDLAEAVDARKAEIEEIALGAQVLVSSCLDELDGLGLDEVRSLLRPRETAVLVRLCTFALRFFIIDLASTRQNRLSRVVQNAFKLPGYS